MFPIAWAAGDTVKVTADLGAWHAITSASFIVQITLLTLGLMSVISWAIMLQKRKQFKEVEDGNIPFEDKFWKAGSLEEIHDHLKDYPDSNLAAVFQFGYLELKKIAESSLLSSTSEGSDSPVLSGLDNLQRALRKATD